MNCALKFAIRNSVRIPSIVSASRALAFVALALAGVPFDFLVDTTDTQQHEGINHRARVVRERQAHQTQFHVQVACRHVSKLI